MIGKSRLACQALVEATPLARRLDWRLNRTLVGDRSRNPLLVQDPVTRISGIDKSSEFRLFLTTAAIALAGRSRIFRAQCGPRPLCDRKFGAALKRAMSNRRPLFGASRRIASTSGGRRLTCT